MIRVIRVTLVSQAEPVTIKGVERWGWEDGGVFRVKGENGAEAWFPARNVLMFHVLAPGESA